MITAIVKRLAKLIPSKAPQSIITKDGMKAHYEGFKLEDNPYKKHTPEHSIWRDDWLFSAGRFK